MHMSHAVVLVAKSKPSTDAAVTSPVAGLLEC